MKMNKEEKQSYLASILDSVTVSLEEKGNKSKIKQMEKYLKNTVKMYGNFVPSIYSIYDNLKRSILYKELSKKNKFDLSILFLKQSYYDHKLISVCILVDLVKKITRDQIEILKETIKEGTVNNWAICDSISSKFCKVYALLSKENTIYIADWKQESNIWLKRMSCVSFVNRIKHKDCKPNFRGFIELMFTVCEKTILSNQRFNQLATGWLLRELALVDYKRYHIFFIEYYNHFTREAVRYSIEKLTQQKKKEILCYRPSNKKEEDD